MIVFGLNPGIDFTGGSILEIEYSEIRPSNQEIAESLSVLELGEISVQPSDDKGVIIRMKDIPEEIHSAVLQALAKTGVIEEKRFESVGPIIGKELKEKTAILIILSLFSIVLYIIFAFRKVRRPVPSWQYGIVSLIALFHDVLVPLGIFSVLGALYGVEISIPVITALLTVIGCSINNVIVVFDRVRENIIKRSILTFEDTLNASLNQTLDRCINTSLVYLLPLVAIFFFGGLTLKYFALALIIGIITGTYSSIFLVAP